MTDLDDAVSTLPSIAQSRCSMRKCDKMGVFQKHTFGLQCSSNRLERGAVYAPEGDPLHFHRETSRSFDHESVTYGVASRSAGEIRVVSRYQFNSL